MGLKEHYFDPTRHQLPKSWDDLSDAQVKAISHILHKVADSPLRDRMILTHLVPNEGFWIITEADAIAALSFIANGQRRTKALLPIKIGLQKFHGPTDRLDNISFGEYITAEAAFNAFYETSDEAKLDRLCATLFRPKKLPWEKFSGDVRRTFDSNDVQIDAKKWAKVALAEKLAIAVYFAGCKEHLANTFPKIFKKNNDQKAKPDKAIWLKSLRSMANGLPNYDVILETRLNLVFFEMTGLIETNERMKAEMEAAKSRR